MQALIPKERSVGLVISFTSPGTRSPLETILEVNFNVKTICRCYLKKNKEIFKM